MTKPEDYAVEYCRPVEDAVADRYGDAHGLKISENEIITHMLMHRSIRQFTSEPVKANDAMTAIAAAQSAATSSHLQSWSVIKITDPERKSEVNKLCGSQRQIDTAPLMLIWLADQSRNYAIGEMESASHDGFDYFESILLGIVDSCIAAQNAALAFESLGYGTCFIGAVRNNAEMLGKLLNLPDRCVPVTGLVVGRPDPQQDTDIKPRLAQNVVMHDEFYKSSTPAEIAEYNRVMNSFQRKQDLNPVDWSAKVAARLSSKTALHGRDRYMNYLRSVRAGVL
ncbi:nitroreductase family protein [Aliirhizobium cellulosilyticum]|uniref:Nitroreductase n=1 Tax=Aliirhizobium cellulosilyticum TaxID=393664 RepID=A0A7W6UZ40_9HYPH|nr:nitroreductase [Rhizobium cellulosilyticum]MBB4412378.1 nitroreductase [Rhizobium cellulosilyticum]MBB4447010.1 nitroreductase [Rhizobium cellulosilyticum]